MQRRALSEYPSSRAHFRVPLDGSNDIITG